MPRFSSLNQHELASCDLAEKDSVQGRAGPTRHTQAGVALEIPIEAKSLT